MDEDDFEGTLILEKLAKIGKLDDFFEAIDSDNFELTAKFMRKAGVDLETIQIVLKIMNQ
jgi:hypothetical protein